MYTIGQFVILKSGGVWSVTNFADGTYFLRSRDGSRKKIIPEGDKELVRAVLSRKELDDVISRIPYIRTIPAPNNNTRIELYAEAMAAFDEIEWIKVIKTVYLRGQEKYLPDIEYSYGERAKQYFYEEASVLLDIPLDQVEPYIIDSINNDNW